MSERVVLPSINPKLPAETKVVFGGKEYRPGDRFEYRGDACEVLEFMRVAFDQIKAQYPDQGWGLGVEPGPWQRLCEVQQGLSDAFEQLREVLRADPDNPVPLPAAQPSDTANVADDPATLATRSRQPAVTPAPGDRQDGPLNSAAQRLADPEDPASLEELADELTDQGRTPEQVDDDVDRARRGDPQRGERHPFRSREEAPTPATVADPVSLFTGEFVLTERDLHLPGRGLDFDLVRRYCSGPPAYGPFGFNWDHNWNVYARDLADGSVAIWTGQLREQVFEFQPDGSYTPPPGVFAALTRSMDPSGAMTGFELAFRGGLLWRLGRPPGHPDGERWPLLSRQDRCGNTQRCHYDDTGRLALVEDTLGRPITFHYGDCGRLEAVEDFSGRTIRYLHTDDTEHLAVVVQPPTEEAPGGARTTYEYHAADHPLLRHSITTVLDAHGRPTVENTYGEDPSQEDYGRVVRQTFLGEEYHYEYLRSGYLIPAPELANTAVMQVCVHEPACPLRLYTFSMSGELLDERYRLRADGSLRIWATTYTYDAHGNPSGVRRPDGLTLSYTWDSTSTDPREWGNLTALDLIAPPHRPQPPRRILTITYEARHQQVRTVTDEAGAVTTYTFDYEQNPTGAGRALPVRVEHPDCTLPDGSVQTAVEHLAYDTAGLLTERVSAEGRTEKLIRGADGQVTQLLAGTGADAVVLDFGYDLLGRPATVTSATGRVTRTSYDALDRLTTVQRTEVAGAQGTVTYLYDPDGWLREQRTPVGGFREPDGTPLEFVSTEFQRDPRQSTWSVTEAANTSRPRRWRYERTCTGDSVRAITDPLGRVTRLTHDERGLVLQQTVTDPAGSESTWRFRYDRNGNMLRSIDPVGLVTDYRYDTWGRLVERRLPGASGRRTSVHFDYAPMDRISSVRVEGEPGPGQGLSVLFQVSQEHDERGRLVRRRQGPHSARLWFDRDGYLLRLVDQRGRVIRTDRDTLGRVVAATDPVGNQVRYRYNSDGDLHRVTHVEVRANGGAPDQFVSTNTYDVRGRLTEVVDTLGNARVVTYDDRDLPVRIADPGQPAAINTFDAFGSLISTEFRTAAGPRSCQWQRDDLGRLGAYVDPAGNRTAYRYGMHDRWEVITYPDLSQRRRTYDAAGRTRREVSADGVVTSFLHAEDGRPSRVSRVGGTRRVPVADTLIGRDGLGRPVDITEGSQRLRLGYDALGRLTSETRAGRTIQMVYDDPNGQARVMYPDGRRDTVTFDELGRLSRVTLTQPAPTPQTGTLPAGAVLSRYAFHGPERLATRELGNGVVTSYTYDAGGRLAGIVDQRAGSPHATVTRYVHDALGRRVVAQGSPLPASTIVNGFDVLGRLTIQHSGVNATTAEGLDTQAQQDAFVIGLNLAGANQAGAFVYDDADFLRSEENEQGTRTWHRGPDGRPAGITTTAPGAAPVTAPYAHDRDGNRVQDERLTYRYDTCGRLREVRRNGALQLTLNYDPLGRLIESDHPTHSRRIWYLGPRPLHEEDATGTPTLQHTLGTRHDEFVLRSNGTNRWGHQDARMSLLAVTDDSGKPIERYTYSPYGRCTVFDQDGATQRTNTTLGSGLGPVFGGHEAILGNDLYDGHARTFDAATGRWLQPDPRGHVDSSDLYLYCGGDPADHMDPSGEVLPIIAALAILGALTGAGYSFWDASEHPERYAGDFSWRALFQVFGGAAAGAGAGATAQGALLMGGGAAAGGTASGVGGAGSLTLLQKVVLGGGSSALSGFAWRSGFHALFPEYADPPSPGSTAFDFATGGVLGPFTVGPTGVLAADAIPASFAPRAFSNNWRLILNPRTKFGPGNLFTESRVGRSGFKLVSAQYWRASRGADGKALHHLWIQQQTALPGWLEPLRNSGANLLEIGGPLNSWMGGRLLREWGFRTAVASALATIGYGSYSATTDLLYGDRQTTPWPDTTQQPELNGDNHVGTSIPEPTTGDQGAAPTDATATTK
ncbi:hypothetical protein BN12_4040011 [Nostocoides japonicum T1-X7]|uniref:Uncharacterized protein n=1 Tax=Nostocoides japonicum T1-X7 TaxID=1194083 RepID=A0A077M4Z6_9MICO|nr:DUF6531 domain-containing protein [Tetrasphaera japonica]CCH79179.1 hypothetical protein BN12_4040011 [Tetrasphaera japonica T1-X7]